MIAVQIESPATERAKLAREAMAECNNNRVQAVALYQRWLAEDPELYARLAPSFVEDGTATDIAGVDAHTRRSLRTLAIRSAPDHPSQLRPLPKRDVAPSELIAAQSRQDDDKDFHQWPLPGGMTLGDATPADVLLGIKQYTNLVGTHVVNKRFLELVYEAMHGGSCVRKVLSHAALLRLRRQAEEGK